MPVPLVSKDGDTLVAVPSGTVTSKGGKVYRVDQFGGKLWQTSRPANIESEQWWGMTDKGRAEYWRSLGIDPGTKTPAASKKAREAAQADAGASVEVVDIKYNPEISKFHLTNFLNNFDRYAARAERIDAASAEYDEDQKFDPSRHIADSCDDVPALPCVRK